MSQQAAGTATQRVQQLLESIPQDLLAQAAAQCGAHARALLHYEAHLRAKGVMLNPVARKNVYASDQEVSFLQVCQHTNYRLLAMSVDMQYVSLHANKKHFCRL